MSKTGHCIVSAAVGTTIAIAQPHLAVLGFVAALAGTIPDAIEVVTGFDPAGERCSVIPHRTLTHSPWIWLALLGASMLLPEIATPIGTLPLRLGLAGVVLAALLHLLLDLFSPSGIPLGDPFGARTSLGPYRSGPRLYLYHTGTAEELPIVLPFLVLLVVALAKLAAEIAPFFRALLP